MTSAVVNFFRDRCIKPSKLVHVWNVLYFMSRY